MYTGRAELSRCAYNEEMDRSRSVTLIQKDNSSLAMRNSCSKSYLCSLLPCDNILLIRRNASFTRWSLIMFDYMQQLL